jgi:hypothetical protein
MKTKLRNITITLEEKVARWARIEAATRDTSVSRFLGDILKERMMQSENNEGAEKSDQSGKLLLKSESQYLSPEELRVLSPDKAAKLAAIRAITEKSAALLKGPPIDHAEMLYDENGLPK